MAFEAIPEQAAAFSPHTWLNIVPALLSENLDPVTHERDDIMQSQSVESGAGGNVSDASHANPVVGHDRATVLLGIYALDAVDEGEAEASCVERLPKSAKVETELPETLTRPE